MNEALSNDDEMRSDFDREIMFQIKSISWWIKKGKVRLIYVTFLLVDFILHIPFRIHAHPW